MPAFGEGIDAILSLRGFDVARPPDPMEWLRTNHADAAMMIVEAADGGEVVQALSASHPDLAIVALLQESELAHCRCLLDSGARAVLPWDASSTEIVQAMVSAMHGLTTLPSDLARGLAQTSFAGVPHDRFGGEELVWLRELARGGSVVALARQVGYSQREVYRRLANLYRQMGVGNRPEAIARAAQWGLLND